MVKPIPRALLPHMVTIKNYTGEVDGVAQYHETTLKYVRCEITRGATIRKTGNVAVDKLLVMIDSITSRIIQGKNVFKAGQCYLLPEEWDNLGDEKSQFWTLHENGNDEIIFSNEKYSITMVDTLCGFSDTVHHWEVSGK